MGKKRVANVDEGIVKNDATRVFGSTAIVDLRYRYVDHKVLMEGEIRDAIKYKSVPPLPTPPPLAPHTSAGIDIRERRNAYQRAGYWRHRDAILARNRAAQIIKTRANTERKIEQCIARLAEGGDLHLDSIAGEQDALTTLKQGYGTELKNLPEADRKDLIKKQQRIHHLKRKRPETQRMITRLRAKLHDLDKNHKKGK